MTPRRSTILLMTGCLALTVCSKPKEARKIPDTSPPRIASNVPALYLPFYRGLTPEDGDVARSQLPFDSISLSRTGCLGSCPAYELVLYRDGRAELDAHDHTPTLGKFLGQVRLQSYGKLCYLIESSRFSEMDSNYRAQWTDAATCIVTVTRGRTTTSVSDYGAVGPIQLWAIQEAVDAVKDEIQWDAVN